jgi:hypothetical protein
MRSDTCPTPWHLGQVWLFIVPVPLHMVCAAKVISSRVKFSTSEPFICSHRCDRVALRKVSGGAT